MEEAAPLLSPTETRRRLSEQDEVPVASAHWRLAGDSTHVEEQACCLIASSFRFSLSDLLSLSDNSGSSEHAYVVTEVVTTACDDEVDDVEYGSSSGYILFMLASPLPRFNFSPLIVYFSYSVYCTFPTFIRWMP
jgi:hypothetical protein